MGNKSMKNTSLDTKNRALQILNTLRKATQGMTEPASLSIIEKYGKDPFLVLISCLLSLRAKDSATLPVSVQLFSVARTPQQILQMPISQLEQILFSIGFYHRKAQQLHEVSKELLDRFGGKVPNTLQDLMSIKGVGLKTANLVLSVGFDIPALCVDIHVHRIANRLGIIATKTPEETEKELTRLLPQEYWHECNRYFVMWGQNICVPVSPKCSVCPLFDLCARVGVGKSR